MTKIELGQDESLKNTKFPTAYSNGKYGI